MLLDPGFTLQRQTALQIERLIDTYQRGALSVEELQGRRERLEATMAAARARAEQPATQEMDRARLDRLGEDLAAFAATLRSGLGNLDFAGRRRLLQLLVERVVVTGDHVAGACHPAARTFCRVTTTASTSSPVPIVAAACP